MTVESDIQLLMMRQYQLVVPNRLSRFADLWQSRTLSEDQVFVSVFRIQTIDPTHFAPPR
jgi:hypothetical protein